MARKSIKAQLEAQQMTIAAAKEKAEKIKMGEAKRLLKVFNKVGFFDVDITDKALEDSLHNLVKQAAGSQQTPESAMIENA